LTADRDLRIYRGMRFEERGAMEAFTFIKSTISMEQGRMETFSIYQKYHFHGASLTPWKFRFWKYLYYCHGKFSIWVMVYIAPLKRW
jgi:hypothetical protein